MAIKDSEINTQNAVDVKIDPTAEHLMEPKAVKYLGTNAQGGIGAKKALIADRQKRIKENEAEIAKTLKKTSLTEEKRRKYVAKYKENIAGYKFDIMMAQAYIDWHTAPARSAFARDEKTK